MAVYLLLGDDEERKARGVERLRQGRPVEARLWRLSRPVERITQPAFRTQWNHYTHMLPRSHTPMCWTSAHVSPTRTSDVAHDHGQGLALWGKRQYLQDRVGRCEVLCLARQLPVVGTHNRHWKRRQRREQPAHVLHARRPDPRGTGPQAQHRRGSSWQAASGGCLSGRPQAEEGEDTRPRERRETAHQDADLRTGQ